MASDDNFIDDLLAHVVSAQESPISSRSCLSHAGRFASYSFPTLCLV